MASAKTVKSKPVNVGVVFSMIFIVIVLYYFWGYNPFYSYATIMRATSVLCLCICWGYGFNNFLKSNAHIIKWLVISTLLSMSVSWLYWDQPFLHVLSIYSSYLFIMFFFCLSKCKADIKSVETGLLILAVLYTLCWYYQTISLPDIVFGTDHDTDVESAIRGFYRYWIPTKEHMPFIIFYSLMAFFNKFRFHYIYLIIAIGFIAIVFMHVARQMIVWTFLSAFLYVVYVYRKNLFKVIASFALIIIAFSSFIENTEIFRSLNELSEDQLRDVNDDIRLEAIKHYTFDHSPNILTDIVGTGIATETPGSKLDQLIKTEADHGYYISDVGFWGLYANFGLLGVILYIILLIKILRMKVEQRHIYVKFYFIYLYGSFIFAHALTTNIFFETCAFYILYRSNQLIKAKNLSIAKHNKDSKLNDSSDEDKDCIRLNVI